MSFPSAKKNKKSFWGWNLVKGTLDTSQVRGEQGSTWKASRKRHHGGIWETSGKHLAKQNVDITLCL